MTWATDYAYHQAQATAQPQLTQYGMDNHNHPFDFVPESTPQAQWCYPAVDGTYGESAYCSSAHAPSASSESIDWGLLQEGHPTLSASSNPTAYSSSFDPLFAWDGSMPSFDSGGLETSRCSGSESSIPPSEIGHSDERGAEAKQSTTVIEHNTEASWGERAVSEPETVPFQKESAQPGSVSLVFLEPVHLSISEPVLPS